MLVLITSSRIFLILIKGEKGEYRFVTRKCEPITPFYFYMDEIGTYSVLKLLNVYVDFKLLEKR